MKSEKALVEIWKTAWKYRLFSARLCPSAPNLHQIRALLRRSVHPLRARSHRIPHGLRSDQGGIRGEGSVISIPNTGERKSSRDERWFDQLQEKRICQLNFALNEEFGIGRIVVSLLSVVIRAQHTALILFIIVNFPHEKKKSPNQGYCISCAKGHSINVRCHFIVLWSRWNIFGIEKFEKKIILKKLLIRRPPGVTSH